MAELRQLYPGYRQLALAIGAAGLEAIQVGQTNPSQAVFDEKVAKTIDAYVNLITKTTVQQRAQITFQQITAAIKELGYANRHWNDADGGKQRTQYLLNAKSRLEGMQEIASRPDYPDGIW
jgi:maltoporin